MHYSPFFTKALRSCLNLVLQFYYASFSATLRLFFAPYLWVRGSKRALIDEKTAYNKF